MENIKLLSNAELLEFFVAITQGQDPGPNVADAIADIENAGEDMTTELVKKARKIVVRYLEKYMNGEDAEIHEEDERYYEQEGGKRRRSRKSRRSKKSRKSRKSRKSKKSRRGNRKSRSRRR
jgi:hypothetical protein